MNAKTQYQLGALDLQVVLALTRSGTLAGAGAQLAVDASTIFRTIQRIEKGLGVRLFERSRSGYRASELAAELAAHGEQLEAQLELARSATQTQPGQVGGAVRLSTTDTLLHGLLAPQLAGLVERHPLLSFELNAGNDPVDLTRRDADIALRATVRPPSHLVGKHLGPVRVAMFGARGASAAHLGDAAWIGVDDALPAHPSVLWRKKHLPRVTPAFRVNSILTVADLVEQGLGVGILPLFLAQRRGALVQLGEVLDECQTELWLLAHTEARHLRRVSAVFSYLGERLQLV